MWLVNTFLFFVKLGLKICPEWTMTRGREVGMKLWEVYSKGM